jgi:hypothetical protein
MNSYNPLYGFYLNENIERSSYIESIFQYDFAYETIEKILKTSCTECSFSLCDLILEKIEYEFSLVKDKAAHAYFMYKELLGHYKPTSIILPGTTYPWYSMIMQIADSFHIPVIIVLDGYQTYMNKYEFSINRNNEQTLIKNYAVMGFSGQKLMLSKRFSMVNKVRIRPPLLDFYNNVDYKISEKHYGAIILFPYPIISNPNSRCDLRFKYVVDVVKCLKDIGIKNLMIKVKDGDNGGDINVLREILDISLHSDVKVETGGFYKYVNLTDLVVGGMGTSIVESAYKKTPYYVYEPYYNGITDDNIKNSILEKGTVFRDIESLKDGVFNGSYSVLNKEDLFEGIKMSEINFKKLFV